MTTTITDHRTVNEVRDDIYAANRDLTIGAHRVALDTAHGDERRARAGAAGEIAAALTAVRDSCHIAVLEQAWDALQQGLAGWAADAEAAMVAIAREELALSRLGINAGDEVQATV